MIRLLSATAAVTAGALPGHARHALLRRGLAATAALLVGACATLTAPPDRLHTGRFSASTILPTGSAPASESPQSVAGRFTVEVRGARRIVDVASPLGTTIARIDIAPGSATATGPQMQTATGPDPDALVEQLLGWRLPVAGLADWIEGRPSAGRPARTEGEPGRLSVIEQDGWLIRIAEHTAAGSPRLLTMERAPTARAQGLRVRLVLEDPS